MKKRLLLVVILFLTNTLILFGYSTEDTITASFTPDYYEEPLPAEDTITVSFTPDYMPPPTEDTITVSFTPDYQPMAKITDLEPDAGKTSTFSVTLAWTAPGYNDTGAETIDGQYQIIYSTYLGYD